MNVKELKEMLDKYPDDMLVVNGRCSDMQIIESDEWSVVKGVGKIGWVMRSHATMSEENKAQEQSYLYLKGN